MPEFFQHRKFRVSRACRQIAGYVERQSPGYVKLLFPGSLGPLMGGRRLACVEIWIDITRNNEVSGYFSSFFLLLNIGAIGMTR